jgi:trehalose-phosphatase
MHPPSHLFDSWTQVTGRLRRAKALLLLLDFDGTLVGFRRNPADVKLEEPTRSVLERLADCRRVTLAFISGRRRGDLLRRVNVPGAQYWGVHGWESRPGMRLNGSSRRALLQARYVLDRKVRHLPGVWLEDKQAALVLHYRGAHSEAAREGRAALRIVLGELGPHFRILRGKKISELLPAEVKGKGEVAGRLADRVPSGTLTVYAGDDTTDEAAFAALTDGFTIRVGKAVRTQARFWLRNPMEVRQFLQRLATAIENSKLETRN